MSRGTITISKNAIIFALLTLIMFEPMSISSTMPMLHSLWEGIRYIVFAFMMLKYLLVAISNISSVSKVAWFALAFYIWQMVSTLYNISISGTSLYQGSMFALLGDAYSAFGIIACVSYMIDKDLKSTLEAMAFVLGAYSLINLITVLVYPDGYYTIGYAGYFLGDKNNHITTTLVGTFCCLTNALYKKGRFTFTSLVVLIANFLNALLLGSFTSLYAFLTIIVGVILIICNFDFKNIVKKLFLGALAFCVIVVVMGSSTFIGNLIDHITTRSITFYTRFETWQKALDIIKNHMLVGNGYINRDILLSKIGGSHAHNYYLECLLRGGLILLAIWLFMVLGSFSQIDRVGEKNEYTRKVHMLFAFVMCAIMLACVFEAYLYFRNFFAVFIIASCNYSDLPVFKHVLCKNREF